MDSKPEGILYISFNQDYGCFVCGTESSIRVYNSIPYKGTFKRSFKTGISCVSMLDRTNILAFIGNNTKVKYPKKKVMIWDDRQEKCIAELSFNWDVKSIKLRKERIVVVTENKIYIFNFADLKFIRAIDTFDNPLGLCAVSSDGEFKIACPSVNKGYLHIINSDGTSKETKAHESALSTITMTSDGKMCATTSDKGTLIRIFESASGKLVQELRRGSDKAEIQSVCFDPTGTWIACSSDKETIHIFSVREDITTASHISLSESTISRSINHSAKNPTSLLKFMKGIVPYLNSEWSFAQFRIPHKRAIVGFGEPGKPQIIVVTYDGKYYKAEFDPKSGGECNKIEEKYLFSDK